MTCCKTRLGNCVGAPCSGYDAKPSFLHLAHCSLQQAFSTP